MTIRGKAAAVGSDNRFEGTLPVTASTNPFAITAVDPSGNSRVASYQVDQSGQARALTYDANGDLINDGTRTLEWDARDQLVASTVGGHRSEFRYDGDQRRVRIIEKEGGVVQSDTRIIWCDGAICEERSDDQTVVRRAFQDGEQVAGISHSLVTDHLGSVTEMTDASATLLVRYNYDPWGRRTTVSGSGETTVGLTGHRWQANGSIWLAMFRGYDPDLGRWISEDPIGLADGQNRYQYVRNNLIRNSDSFGLRVFCRTLTKAYDIPITDDSYCGPGLAACNSADVQLNNLGPCRQKCCGSWGFDVTVTQRIFVYLRVARKLPSAASPGLTLEQHEALHTQDLKGWCRSLNSKLKTEGFKTRNECELARLKVIDLIRQSQVQASQDTERRRDTTPRRSY